MQISMTTQNVAKRKGGGNKKRFHHYSHSVMIYRAPRLEETKKEPRLENSARKYLEGGRGKRHKFEGVSRKGINSCNTERSQLALLLLGRAAHGVRRLPADLERRAAAGFDAEDVDDLGDAGALAGG